MIDHTGRPGIDEYAEFYRGYVQRVPPGGLADVLSREVGETIRLLESVPEDRADWTYAPGKWSIREIVGHVVDAERVFSYRALRFGRGDETELPGFDQTLYVPAGAFADRSLGSLIEEFAAVRRATVLLFRSLPTEAWVRRGVAAGHEASVRALACIIAGHELHHRAILAERYVPSLESFEPGAPR